MKLTGVKIFGNGELVMRGIGQLEGEIILKSRTDKDSKVIMETEQTGDSFEAKLNLSDVQDILVNYEFGDFIYESEKGDSHYLSLEYLKELERETYSLLDRSAEFHIYKNLKENLSFKSEYSNVKIDKISIEENVVNVHTTDLFLENDRLAIVVTGMENKEVKYQEMYELKKVKDSQKIAKVSLATIFSHFIVSPKNKYTLYYELAILNNKNEIAKSIRIKKEWLILSKSIMDNFRLINSNSLEFKFPNIKIGTLSVDREQTQLINFYLNSLGTEMDFKGIFLKRRIIRKDSTDNTRFLPLESQFKIENNTKIVKTKIEYEKLFLLVNSNIESIYDAYVLVEWDKKEIYYPLCIDNIYKDYFTIRSDMNNKLQAEGYVTSDNTLAISFSKVSEHNEENRNAIKIAIIGSCYSRLIFSSAKYYNRYYKNKYEVVSTVFHSSVASMMSESVDYDEQIIDAIENETIRDRISTEFKKNQLEIVKNSSPNFIIIDIYADVIFHLLEISKKQYITENYQFKKNNSENAIIEKHDISKIRDIKVSEKLFLNYLDGYLEALKTIVPEERIILQKVRMATSQIKNGKVVPYTEEQLENIKSYNVQYERFENYILERMQKIQVIDIDYKKYRSDIDFPLGVSPNHYESKFYKDVMSEVNDIILSHLIQKDRIKSF
ncbi:MAG: DUF6270 domain-containing protein [Carnobacterium maltaromaticum]